MSIDRSLGATRKGSDETLAMADKGEECRKKMGRRRPRRVRSDDLWGLRYGNQLGTIGDVLGTSSPYQVFAVMQSNQEESNVSMRFGTFVYENI